jgi:hypothetical protein
MGGAKVTYSDYYATNWAYTATTPRTGPTLLLRHELSVFDLAKVVRGSLHFQRPHPAAVEENHFLERCR